MGKFKCKIDKLDKKHKYKLEIVLDIIITLDYSNALSSSNDTFCIDSTSNNYSSDLEDSNKNKEIIPPSLKP